MEKGLRIKRLDELRLNVPAYRTFASKCDRFYFDEKPAWSIRTFPNAGMTSKEIQESGKGVLEACTRLGIPVEPGVVPPHAPLLNNIQARAFLDLAIDFNFQAIGCAAIDPKDSLWAGAVYLDGDSITLEIARGPCMVRKVTREGHIDYRVVANRHSVGNSPDSVCPTSVPKELRKSIFEAIKTIFDKVHYSSMILELSYYNVPVGQRFGERLIFWDGHIPEEDKQDGW